MGGEQIINQINVRSRADSTQTCSRYCPGAQLATGIASCTWHVYIYVCVYVCIYVYMYLPVRGMRMICLTRAPVARTYQAVIAHCQILGIFCG